MSNRPVSRRRIVAASNANAPNQPEADPNDETRMSQDDHVHDEDDETVEATPASSGSKRAQKRGRPSVVRDSLTPNDKKRARANNDDAAAAGPSQQLWSQPSSAADVSGTMLPPSEFDLCLRSGKVSRIVLKNFMCHSHLAVDLNNRINLMIGHNGSGKSAILTALVIGMGSKASVTSRSSSLTQLIKRGENNATIEIHLDNHPWDGYEVAKYGERIIVQRSIFSTGRSVYKIKSASGTVVSTRRDELFKMMMFLNIQVDNPVCVLNQDASRSFLRDSDPKKRYLLFLKATQIETILEKLHGCTVHVRTAKVHLRSLQQQALTYQQTVSDLTDRLAHLRSVGDLRKHVRSLRCQQSWKQTIVQEQLTAEIAATMAEFQQEYDKLQATSGSKTAMEERIREEMRECLRLRDESLAAMVDDQAAHEAMRTKVRDKRQVHEQMQRSLRKLETQRERVSRDVRQLQSDLAERLAQTDEMSRVQRERVQNEAKLVQLRQQVEDSTAMLASALRDTDMTINTKSETMNGTHELKRERQEYRSQCDRLKRDIAQCDSAANDSLLIYGAYMTRMVAAIEAAHKRGQFTRLPLGPLGRYVQLEDDRWKLPIENLMGGHVQSFIVNDAADRRVLSELIRKQFPEHARHSIISTRFVDKVYDVRAGAVRPPQGTRLAMDVLRVSNAVVMNCLIDQCKVETILLTEDERVAMRLTSDEENVPEHLQRIVLLQPFSVFYPEPNYRSYSIDQRHAKYLQVDVAQRRQHLDHELRGLIAKMKVVERSLAQQEARVDAITQTLATMGKDRQKLEFALRQQRLEIADLEKIEYPEENDAEYFRKELAELQAAQDETDVAIEAESRRVAEHAELMDAKEAEMAELKATVQRKSAVGRELQRQHDEAKQRLESNAVNAQYNEAKCRAMDGDMQKLRVELADAQTKVARLEATAAKLGERIVTKYSDEELQRKLSVKERRIVAIESTEEPLDLVERRLANGKEALEHAERLIKTLAETMNMLSVARKKRFETLKHLKENMSLRVRHTFNSLLKLRNYSGEITIDDQAQELQLSVVPRDKHIENAVSNAKSLSGGERSYSTIAFLLSLWSCVNFPFYFLDEYDVFTDQVNRHYITKLLLNEAEKKPTRQYTFLTPQDMSNVSATDDLTIHRLAEPDR